MPPASWSITDSLLTQLRSAARSVYPLEFISLLGVSAPGSRVLSELVVVPAEFGYTHSGLHWDLIPFDPLIVGTIHSHPSPSMRPSPEDLDVFSRLGAIHLILGHPYGVTDFRAYSARGTRLSLPVVRAPRPSR